MQGIEQLIRESLQARATDVEPTPMLWLEVDRRVARRKRFQVATWSLAGATAALAAVVAVPGVVDLVQPDRTPDIGAVPMEEGPVAGVVPEFYVTDVDGELQVREVGTDEPGLPGGGGFELPANEIEVRPGSRGADYSILSTHGGDGTQPGFLAVVDSYGAVEGGRATRADGSATTLPAYEAAPNFTPSAVWAPDQDAAAVTLPMPEADQTNVVLWSTPDPDEDVDVRELGLVLGEGEVELLDWVGQTTDTGDGSVLYFRDDLGVHAQQLTVADDGSMIPGDGPIMDGVLDIAGAHVEPGSVAPPTYALVEGDGGVVLQWIAEGDRTENVPLSDLFGGVDPAALWLDAKQDAALVGDGSRTFLFAHDGTGDFVEPVEFDTAGPAALFDGQRPGEPEPEPSEPSAEDPSEEPAPGPTQTDEPAPAVGAALPEPVVTATVEDLVLHGPDGEQVLYTLPQEGESTFLSVAVRPGSTVDDLTIVALHLAEGMQDFRTYRYVDGELSVEYWERPEFQPGFGGDLGGSVAAFGPVWHPAGDKLAWIETGTSGTPQLRIIGWTDDGPGTGRTADDNTSFTLDGFEGIVVEPLEWVDLGDGQTEIRAVSEDGATQWIAIPVEVQGDGAATLPSESSWWRSTPAGDGFVRGLAGTLEDGSPRWMLRGQVVALDPMGEARTVASLPEEFFPGEGIADTWMREAGDGVLVGMSNTGLAYYVTPAGDLAQVGEDAWMHGDVVD